MLTVHAEETVASRNAAEIVFRCTSLDNKDWLSKSVSKHCIAFMVELIVIHLLHNIVADLHLLVLGSFSAYIQKS